MVHKLELRNTVYVFSAISYSTDQSCLGIQMSLQLSLRSIEIDKLRGTAKLSRQTVLRKPIVVPLITYNIDVGYNFSKPQEK